MSKSIRIDFEDGITDKEFVYAANLLAEIALLLPKYETIVTLDDGFVNAENLNAWKQSCDWVDGEEEEEGAEAVS